jgi:RNA polymerase sigma factor FliA
MHLTAPALASSPAAARPAPAPPGEVVARKELAGLLAARIAQLPEMPRKVLALYYYENLRLADIAVAFGLTESRICQIHTQAVKQLRANLQSVMA